MKNPACFNLGLKEKKKRIFAGVLCFAAGAAVALYFVFQETPSVTRLVVFPLFFLALLCFLQAKERTCVLLAFRKEKILDQVREPLEDTQLCRQLMLKAQKILLQAFVLAFALTFLASVC